MNLKGSLISVNHCSALLVNVEPLVNKDGSFDQKK